MLSAALLVVLSGAPSGSGDVLIPPVESVSDEEWVFHASWSDRERKDMVEIAGRMSKSLRDAEPDVAARSFEERFWKTVAPAVRNDVVRMVRETARTGDVRLASANRMSLLGCAMLQRKHDLAKTLVRRGADVNLRSLVCLPSLGEDDVLTEGDSPFSLALCPAFYPAAGRSDAGVAMVRLMLDHGAEVDGSLNRQWSHLELALVGSGYRDWDGAAIADMLLERGSAIAPDREGKVMALAVRSGSVPLVRKLVERGMDVNALYENAPAWAAVNFRYPHSVDMLEWLLAHGADTSLVGIPSFFAAADEYPFLFGLVSRSVSLKDGEMRRDTLMQVRALAMAGAVLGKGAKVDGMFDRKTPLFVCGETLNAQSRTGDFAVWMARLLLDHGADASFAACPPKMRQRLARQLEEVSPEVRKMLPELWRE